MLTRSLAEIVKKDDFVLDSEYLVTLLVVVPKYVFLSQRFLLVKNTRKMFETDMVI